MLLAGCNNNEDLHSSTQESQSQNSSIAPTEESSSHVVEFDTAVFGEKSANYRFQYKAEEINMSGQTFLMIPSTVSLFFGDNFDEIGFIYEYGIELEAENITDMPKDEHGNTYLYHGKLEQLSNSVYKVSTSAVISDWQYMFDDGDIDNIYVALDKEKLYMLFNVSENEIESVLSKEFLSEDYYINNYYTFNNYTK